MVDRDGASNGANGNDESDSDVDVPTGATENDLSSAAAAAVQAAREAGVHVPEKKTELEFRAIGDDARIDALELDRLTVKGKRTQLGFQALATALEIDGAKVGDKHTELDVSRAAAAAVAAANLAVGTPPIGPDYQTVIKKTDAPTPVIKPRAQVAYEPTAALAEITSDTPSHERPSQESFEELPEGTLLAGRYHIKELVGHGGMGAVYAAHDDDLDEDIALKALRPALASDTDFQRRLKAEVRLARRVSHPNVCRVHDLGDDDGLVFVTMELVRGHTLRHRLAEVHAGRTEALELGQIVDIIVQLGSALSAAHRAGVIHRDVKPDNVILAGGRAVLTDFGVASMAMDRVHQIVGTPAYLAPEVLLGQPFDHRVDVYAVSCLAYELIAGAPPFAAKTFELAMNLAQQKPTYPALPGGFATPAVRSALDRVLSRGLAPDPAHRTATMERFTDAFAHAARGAPLSHGVRAGRLERLGTQDSSTPIPVLRKTEVRVTTALVWYANRGARDTEEAERIVVDAGGVPIRVATGEIVALFGASRSMGDDADRAAHAALALVAKFNGKVGLDTTRILLRTSDTDLAGPDSASAAATLAHDAREGEVWASQATARQLAARFEISAAMGEARRITAARKVGVDTTFESTRRAELATITGHIERAFQNRKPVFVEVRGSAGSGKTRLRKAVVSAIGAKREVDWLVAVTSPAGEPAPLSIVQSCSADWYEIATGGGTIIEPARRDLAARRWLEMRATHRPVVIIAEDLQWADPSSRALLDHLRGSLENVPVAIVVFTRGEQNDPAPQGTEVVWLGPLDNTRAVVLARSIAPNGSDDAIAELVMRAAGNPFFIEELAREVASGKNKAGTLPTSVEAVVQAHLDTLPESAAQVAITASVIGHGFWRRALQRVMPGLGDAGLDSALGELERHGVIAAATSTIIDDEYYEFTSKLMVDVAYQRIPARERRHYHNVIASWLDEHSQRGEIAAARLLSVAYHRENGGDAMRAALAYRRAGSRCLELFAYGEATAALRKAASLTTVPDATLDEELGDAVAQTEGYAAAEPIYQRSLDETDDDDESARARLYFKLGNAAGRRGNSANAISRFKAGLALAAPGGELADWAQEDPRSAAQLWAALGWTLGYQLGKVDEGHPYCERAVTVLENTPYRRELAQALSRLGGTYMRACRYADQLRCNQRNLEIAVELRDLQMQLTANINLGVAYGVLGDIDQAIEATETARELAARMDAMSSDGLAASNLAGLYIEKGRLDEGDKLLDEAIVMLERTGSRYVLAESYIFRARIAAARGDLASARAHAERSLALARSLGNQLDVAIGLRILAQLDARAGDHEVARTQIEEAFVLAVVNDELEAVRTRAARARILAMAQDPAAEGEFSDLCYELVKLGTIRELQVLTNLDEVR